MTRRHLVKALVALPLAAQSDLNNVVFIGFPSRKSTNQFGSNETVTVSGKLREENLCMISKKGDRYFWSSREGKEMTRRLSGAFVVYSALDGSGYVKCSNAIPDSPVDYMEHVHIQFSTITYWGKSSIQKD